ncbi:hypothetical protein [Comamonas sp. NoAH]|uniref:hypothetical protein n=1 Tax=Comamonas halotolerans TaxID=3041496 RepID=UPI0024E08F10|nr:hypothetical protein [Comamonas sp. NoAH]
MASSTGNKPSPKKPEIDWERIELDYRAGLKTLRQIADEHSISHGAINKRAKRDGWERDLSKKIQSKADALVSKAAVSKEVSKAVRVAENTLIEANALTQAGVRLAHRADIERTRNICIGMILELEQQSVDPSVIAEAAEILRSTPPEEMTKDKRAKLAEAATKAASLQGRSSVMRSLSESLKVLVALERQAFGIREEMPEPPPPGLEAFTTKELLAVAQALKGGGQ